MLRRGSLTSPAVKVTLFHASDEKSDPVCATASAMNSPNALVATTPGATGSTPRAVQKCPRFAATASAFQPRNRPMAMSATTPAVFAVVNRFWMILP